MMAPHPAKGALGLNDVTAGYGKAAPVIAHLSLAKIEPGMIATIAGPNGAGKSTLLRAIAGLIPARGNIMLGDDDLVHAHATKRASLVGFMPPHPSMTTLTVLEAVIVAYNATDQAELIATANRRAVALLEALGILHLAMQAMDRLSTGQRQIVSLAQTIACEPRLLLLDEPTSALDLRYQIEMMNVVRRLADEGRIVLMVVHDLSFAARWSDHMVVLQQGRLDSEGPPRDVITPAMLSRVYGISARVETCSRGTVQLIPDGLAERDSALNQNSV